MSESFVGPLIDAVVKGDEASVNHLIRLGASLTIGDSRGLTALHWTAASSEAEFLVPVLLARGSNIDARDLLGRTPLHFHSAQGRGFGTACLLHRGADVNAQTYDTESSPLHYAAEHNHAHIARILVAYGAKTSILNKNGDKPRDLGLNDLTILLLEKL